ncbi:lipid-A-disaccharide synthase [Stenomitos frigidus]|uniref:Lipid-A-disaccharide synthase n=1 Tax=Stenomitos frigidus ULC18 TaxID=2107698 RepID=A0A2T1DTG0_9CYAN|nr:lipid-A-disaccharide synthase [Stenomitos frigidus]PSB23711.1 lipid-A-disaccharide synthase [Stenomitos frigidus ULC18]
MQPAIDILILSNGPGELATWVKPVVQALRQQMGDDRNQVRLSVVLSPCANASGQEAAIARSYPEVDRVQGAEHFFPFLLWGKTAAQWDWRSHGVVLFLGGDQFFPIVIGKRLGYRTVIYAEWEARWHRWIDRFGVMNENIMTRIPQPYVHKFTVVGDLMAEAGRWRSEERREWGAEAAEGKEIPSLLTPHSLPPHPLIGLLPGSKPTKLSLGVPLCLAIAEQVYAVNPATRFVIPVAPGLAVTKLATFADPATNPAIEQLGWTSAILVLPAAPDERPWLKTRSGLRVDLWTEAPAYDLLSQCSLCLTTVGANTAELGALAVPMLVLIPLQQIDLIKTWDGIPGLLANLPVIGGRVAKLMTHLALKRLGRLAWPNIWANAEIVPELAGALQPKAIAAIVQDLLDHPKKLQQMQIALRQARGQAGAASKLAQLVVEALREDE